MAFNGSGVFQRLYNWVTDRNASIKIQASRMDNEMDGFATGLSNCITKDGQTTITANIPLNSKKITGLGDATADADALNRQTGDARFGNADWSSVASATTTDIGAATSANVLITGTTTITGFGTVAAGTRRTVRFAGTLTLTYNVTSLILPTSADIKTAAGDTLIAISAGSGNWRVVAYYRADGSPLGFGAYESIASAATTSIGGTASNFVNITGTTTITSLGTISAGVVRWVKFAGALTLTYNVTSLILPGAANIVTVAGDTALFVSEGSGNWRCIAYARGARGTLGTATNDNAATGDVGEIIESNVAVGSAVALSTGAAKTITSISLTAGDWDVWGTVSFNPAGTTTITAVAGGINTTTDTLPTSPASGAFARIQATLTTGGGQDLAVGTRRMSLNATTTVYLVGFSSFGTSTMGGYGYLAARRVR